VSIRLTYRDAARIVRQEEAAARDKSYRAYPIGQEVGRFLRAKRVERGARPSTILSYESVLAKFTLRHADMDSLEPFEHPQNGPELLHDFLDHYWGEADEATQRQRMSVLASFFEWAYRTDRVSADPIRRMQRPRRRKTGAARSRVPEPHVSRLVSAAPTLRDQAGILLLGRLALRKNDLRMLQLADIDLARDELYLRHAKGGKEHVLPIAFPDVRQTLYLHLQERGGGPAEYLIYPKSHRNAADERGRDRPLVPPLRRPSWTRRVHDAPTAPRGHRPGATPDRGRGDSAVARPPREHRGHAGIPAQGPGRRPASRDREGGGGKCLVRLTQRCGPARPDLT
jgi:site-specific recombinase XerC